MGGRETENFSGIPRRGSSVRGFIGFGEERDIIFK